MDTSPLVAELARQAGIRAETLNRIERCKLTPSVATVDKLDRAIKAGKSYLQSRATRGNLGKFNRVLAKVPAPTELMAHLLYLRGSLPTDFRFNCLGRSSR